jgi:hypothetical protein
MVMDLYDNILYRFSYCKHMVHKCLISLRGSWFVVHEPYIDVHLSKPFRYKMQYSEYCS